MARIALDAMGGDFGSASAVAGALLALSELPLRHTVQLVGRPELVHSTLDELLEGEYSAERTSRARIDIVSATEVIEMTDKPSSVIRGKPDSSMHVGLRLQAEGKSDGFVSAGNTGAQMAISTMVLRLHHGLTRPAIATLFPTSRGAIVVLDSGANVDSSAEELVQFARLGSVYAEDLLDRSEPAIGLLSIGEESEKGNSVVKEAHQLLLSSGLHFIGNIEGRDLPAGVSERGPFDVVVCDGFVGNVLLKFYEAIAPMLVGVVSRHFGASPEQFFANFPQLDASGYGGAPLLGVRGVSIISHGRSTPRAIKNALKTAVRAVETGLNEHMSRRLGPSAIVG
ncbi:MAG: phosphate acyltransferase PlsX [Gemmatimonadota bacterium]